MRLKNRVAIVTGGWRGIGRGIALALAKDGADVVVADKQMQDTSNVVEEIKALGRKTFAMKVDVTRSSEVNEMVQKVLEKFGEIDILVNNAGIIKRAYVVDTTEEDWDAILNVNLKGVFLCCRAVAPHMMKQRSGKIINISSVAGKRGSAGSAHYCASKFGVIGLTQSLAVELAPFNINVNAVCPGVINTYMWREVLTPFHAKRLGTTNEEAFDKVVKDTIPLGRPQTPEDIGNIVVFLASEEARNITGQAINVDGGSYR